MIDPIEEVIDHADAFIAALVDVDGLVVDLGSGGGVPGLVVAIGPSRPRAAAGRSARQRGPITWPGSSGDSGIEDRVAVRCADALT